MNNTWIKLLILSNCNVKCLLNSVKIYNSNLNYKIYNTTINFLFNKKKTINNYSNFTKQYLKLTNFFYQYKFNTISAHTYLQLLLNSIPYLTKKKLYIMYNTEKKTNKQNLCNYKFLNTSNTVVKKYYININQKKKTHLYINSIKSKFVFKVDKFILNLYYKKKKTHKNNNNTLCVIPTIDIKYLTSIKNRYVYKLFKHNNIIQFYFNTMLNNFFFKYKKKKTINKSISVRKYFSYKIKLKPGFSTLWRLFRQKCKNLYNLNFKFQHSLTKYINIISNIRVYYKLLYWFSNLNKIFTVKFLKFNTNLYVYINGIKLIYITNFVVNFFNKIKLNLTYLCIGDCLQLPYSYKFLLYYKNIYIFNTLIFTQHDISSLSIFYLYHNTLLVNWGYNRKYSHNLFNFKMYNWKYIT